MITRSAQKRLAALPQIIKNTFTEQTIILHTKLLLDLKYIKNSDKNKLSSNNTKITDQIIKINSLYYIT